MECLAYFLVRDRNRLRNALDEIAATHFHRQRIIEREGAAQLNLYLFRSALTNQKVVLAFHILGHRVVHCVARCAHSTRVDDATETNNGDVSGAAADIDDDISVWLGDWQARADRGSNRLFNEVNFRSLRSVGSILDCAALHL